MPSSLTSAARRLFLGGLAVLTFVSGVPVASADEEASPSSSPAEAHIAHGLELRRQRRDEEALVEFRAAYDLGKSGRALAQIALAEDAVGLWVDAEQAFEDVLATGDDPWVEKRRGALLEELRVVRLHLADLALDVVPASGEISLNGAPAHRRKATNAFRVVAGRVLVEVKAAGFETARRVLELAPGARSHEVIALAQIGGTVEPAGQEAGQTADGGATETATPKEPTRNETRRTIGFVTGAVGIVGLGIGTAFAIDTAEKRSSCSANACSNGAFSSVWAAANTATVAFVTGGLLTAAGIVLVLTAPLGSQPKATSLSVAPSLLAGGGGLLLRADF